MTPQLGRIEQWIQGFYVQARISDAEIRFDADVGLWWLMLPWWAATLRDERERERERERKSRGGEGGGRLSHVKLKKATTNSMRNDEQ